MKHFYLYIECGAVLNEDAHFYKVGIGTSVAERRRYLSILATSVDKGHYFAPWSEEACVFLDRCFDSVFGVHDLGIYGAHLVLVNAPTLVRALKSSVSVSPTQQQLANSSRLMAWTNVNYRCFSNRLK